MKTNCKGGARRRRSKASPLVAFPEPAPEALADAVRGLHPEAMGTCWMAIGAVLAYRLHRLRATERPDATAEEIISALKDEEGLSWFAWAMMMEYAIRMARSMPQYYGVLDLENEQYCGVCRKVWPVHKFVNGTLACETCQEKGGQRDVEEV